VTAWDWVIVIAIVAAVDVVLSALRFRERSEALGTRFANAVIRKFRRKAGSATVPEPIKCQGWINLASVSDELRPLTSVRVYCDVPAGEKHPTDGDGDPLHTYRTIYWGARSVPEETDDA